MMLSALRRALDHLYRAAAVLAAACLAVIALLILAQVIGRRFGVIVPSAEDFAGFLMAAATFLALAHTLRSGGHIRVNLAIRNFSPRWRRVQEITVLCIVFTLVAGLAAASVELVIESHAFNDVTGGYIAVPLWIPQLPMAIGLVTLAIALLDELACVIAGRIPSYREHDAPAAARAE